MVIFLICAICISALLFCYANLFIDTWIAWDWVKPKFRVVKREDGRYQIQSKNKYMLFFWQTNSTVYDFIERAEDDVEWNKDYIRRKIQNRAGKKITEVVKDYEAKE